MRLVRCSALFTAVLALVPPPPARADPPPAISGVVVDPSGAVVPGAAVILRQPRRVPRETFTDTAGQFFFDNVPPDPATLSVALPRFRPATVELDGPAPGLRVLLHPAPVSEEVTVRGSAVNVTRSVSATKTETALRDVPQAVAIVTSQVIADQGMRSIADVVRYMPGVGIAQGEGNRDTPVLRGNSTTADFFVDGIRDDAQYLPGRVQRGACRGAQGAQRPDLRARRRRRRHQPRHAAGRQRACRRGGRRARHVGEPARDGRCRQEPGGAPRGAGNRRVRERRQLPGGGDPGPVRREPDGRALVRARHDASPRLRALPRPAHGRPRHPVVSRRAG